MTEQSESDRTVTRAVLRDAVYDSCAGLSRLQASRLVDETLEEICEVLARGESVRLRSFGTFNTRAKRERIGRNPKTGAKAPITARRVLTFKASPVLVAQINGEAIAGGFARRDLSRASAPRD